MSSLVKLGMSRMGTSTDLSQKVVGYINRLEESAGQMDELIQSFGNVYKVINTGPEDIGEVLKRAESSYATLAKQRDIDFSISIEENLKRPVPQPVMTLVLSNLISNALDAVSSGGYIRVRAEISSGQFLCSITSSSVILPQYFQKIWESGFSTRSNGTGLGLPLSREALKRNQGDLTFESKDNETTFTIKLH